MSAFVGKLPATKNQQGVVLIVGLVMVLLISIIALAAIKGSSLQEAMVGNTRDRNVAFQASEAGLSAGESIVDEDVVVVEPVCPATGVCILETTPVNSILLWTDALWTANGVTASLSLPTSSQPLYVVEQLPDYQPDDGSSVDGIGGLTIVRPYRISSKGAGLTADASAIIQSYYHRRL